MSKELLKQIDKTLEIAASTHKLGADIMRSLEAARDALKPDVWEPSGGDWFIDARNEVSELTYQREIKPQYCNTFKDESEANRVAKLRREWQLIAKYVSDWLSDNPGNRRDQCHAIGVTPNGNYQPVLRSGVIIIGEVLMSNMCAIQLANDLNNGRVKL